MIDRWSLSPVPRLQQFAGACYADRVACSADPIGSALSRAYAATVAEPLPAALADLLRSLK